MNDIKKLPYYGIHESDRGVNFLFQDNFPYGMEFLGLGDKVKSGLSVKHLKNYCPHLVNPYLGRRNLSNKHQSIFDHIFEDQLTQAMLPIPNGKTYFLSEDALDDCELWITALEKLSSPLHTCSKPIWTLNKSSIFSQMNDTNIHPMVLTGVDSESLELVKQLAILGKTTPRTLILVGPSDLILPREVQRIKTTIFNQISLAELVSLPLEHLGAKLIADYCKKEGLFKAA